MYGDNRIQSFSIKSKLWEKGAGVHIIMWNWKQLLLIKICIRCHPIYLYQQYCLTSHQILTLVAKWNEKKTVRWSSNIETFSLCSSISVFTWKLSYFVFDCVMFFSAPHDNGKPVIRLQSDTMNSSYAKSNADYLEVLQRKYLV